MPGRSMASYFSKKAPRRTRRTRRTRRRRPLRRKGNPVAKAKMRYRRTDRPAYNRKNAIINTHPNWLPEQLVTELYYNKVYFIGHSGVDIDPIQKYDLHLNYLFDPDSSGTGEYPHGFYQFTNLYMRYMVEEVHYDIQFYVAETASASTSALQSMVGIMIGPQGYGGQFGSVYDLLDAPVHKYSPKHQLMIRSTTGSTNAANPLLGKVGSNGKFRGKIKMKDLVAFYGDTNYLNNDFSQGLIYPQD